MALALLVLAAQPAAGGVAIAAEPSVEAGMAAGPGNASEDVAMAAPDRRGRERKNAPAQPRQGGAVQAGQPANRPAPPPTSTPAPSAPRSGGGLRRGQVMGADQRGAPMGDYARYHLRQPPPGYSYHRVGNQAYLVSDETGTIFEVAPLDH